MPLISVIIPAFNAEQYIADAVNSITSQSFQDMEILVVDDGSTDKTAEILDSLKKADHRIRTLRQANTGIVGALNTGVNASDCQYIIRMDADDISMPDRIISQLAVMESDDEIAVCGSNIEKFGAYNQGTHYPLTDKACKSTLLVNNCFAHPAVIVRRSTLSLLGDTPYKADYLYAEDYKLWSDLAPHGRFQNIRRPLLKYRIHPSQSGSKRKEFQREAHTRVALENLHRIGIYSLSTVQIRALIWSDETLDRTESIKIAWQLFDELSQRKEYRSCAAGILVKQIIKTMVKRKSYI